MKNTTTVRHETELGGAGTKRLSFTLARLGRQSELRLEVLEGEATELEMEDVERLAAAFEAARRDAGDFRSVCADHGYFTGVEASKFSCPVCRAEVERERERAEGERHAVAGAAFGGASL